MRKIKVLRIAVVFVITGIFIRLFTLIQIVAMDNKVDWWVHYLGTLSCGFGALGLLVGAVTLTSSKNRKGYVLMIIHVILLVAPFILFNLIDGITAYNLILE